MKRIALADGGAVLFENVAFQESGAYLPVPAGSYDLEARLAGTNTVVLGLRVVVQDGGVATAVATGRTERWQDVLGTVFSVKDGETALGALAFISNRNDLRFFSRTFNQSDAGTFGQAVPGIASADLIPAGEMKRILFFTENSDYRSNIGILNGTGSPMTIKWRSYTTDGMMVDESMADLPAWGNVQLNRVFSAEAPVAGGYIDVWTETDGAAFAAYGSVLDNATSDPTTVLPQ